MRRLVPKQAKAPGASADTLRQVKSGNPQTGIRARVAATSFAHDFSHIPLQAKLKVNTPGDAYEREADRIAERVTQAPEGIQRSCACGGTCADCSSSSSDDDEPLQRKSAAGGHRDVAVPEGVEELLRGPGTPLDGQTRAFMEPRLGHGFAGVRIHTGAEAAGSAEALRARAYTVGSHIVFGAGEYRPGTTEGKRLLAHELAHVAQQGAAARGGDAVIRRDDKPAKAPAKPRAGTVAANPQLEFRPAKNPPPCACLVFMHREEANARLFAELLFEHCHYNLAIVSAAGGARRLTLPGNGTKDPNELFPPEIAEECWYDDAPCEEYLETNANSAKADKILEAAQRQFFLAIKHCSDGFKLPVVGLHTNSIDDTQAYRDKLAARKPPDVAKIRGKTFDDSLPAGTPGDPRPFAELQQWMLDNVPGVEERKKKKKKAATAPAAGGKVDPPPKNRLTTPGVGVLTKGKTNIFLWCSADENTLCHIGDPEHPDNVVWVTNPADFDKLALTTANVALQTGIPDTDLSTLFVRLPKIAQNFSELRRNFEAGVAVEAASVSQAFTDLKALWAAKGIFDPEALQRFAGLVGPTLKYLSDLAVLADQKQVKLIEAAELHYTNVESPDSPSGKGATKESLRLESFAKLKSVLDTLGVNCCDTTPQEGQSTSAADEVAAGVKSGKRPEKSNAQ